MGVLSRVGKYLQRWLDDSVTFKGQHIVEYCEHLSSHLPFLQCFRLSELYSLHQIKDPSKLRPVLGIVFDVLEVGNDVDKEDVNKRTRF